MTERVEKDDMTRNGAGTPGVRSPFRTIVGPGALFAGMTALGRAIMFLLLPVFTRVLSTEQYGELSILLSIYAVAIIVLALGADITVFRSAVHLEGDADASRDYISQVWTFLIIVPLALAILASAAAAPFLAGSSFIGPEEFTLAMVWAALFVASSTLPLAQLRAENRLVDFAKVSLVGAVVTPPMIVVALVVLDAGVLGWLGASALGSLLTLTIAAVIVPYVRPRRVDLRLIREVLSKSLPVMPHFLSMWSLHLADRLILAGIVSMGAVGVYSLGVNAALPVLVVLVGVNQALMVDYARAGRAVDASEKKKAISAVRRIIELQVAVIAISSVACAVLMPTLINLFIDPAYGESAGLVPWFVLGYALLGLEAIPMNGITLTYGHQAWIWVASLSAAVVNIAGVFFFAEKYGLEAAAIATPVGFAVLLIGVEMYARLINARLDYPWRSVLALIGTAIAVYFLAALALGTSSYFDLLARLGAVVLASLVMLVVVSSQSIRNASRRVQGED